MKNWFNNNFLNKFLAILIAGVFVVVTFACFTMATTHGHSADIGAACETVMSLADSATAQVGFVLLLIAVAVCLCHRSFFSLSQSEIVKKLLVFYSPPTKSLVAPAEYSYLLKLFSSGIIHSKLHSVTI
ncbi:hypothetical protein H6784_06150 [Candidatus Nomurabacteria bacterium]|nr:hypothetical protein [Candidatus Kaiserbacteria bacterium]MCB9811094.1 hypothetical protein [Candidatus Nomurabacteria bacterium]MCB9814954.1 hypothetical protein [Candidatus Nomurabacteria bacterium]